MPDRSVQLVAATKAQKPVFENLIQLYLYDMAAQSPFPVDAHGRYEYDFLDRFWEHPYLILKDGEIAGFCFVIRNSPVRERSPCWFMAEFCILRPYQRQGVGRAALSAILKRHPGAWEISWASDNQPAHGFWPTVIPYEAKETRRVSFEGSDWVCLAFSAEPSSVT